MEEKRPFENIFAENREKIFRLIFRFSGNSIDAEDLTQEVFIRAYRNYGNFRHEADISSWLYRIAINLCKEKIRTREREKKNLGEKVSLDIRAEDNEGQETERQYADSSDKGPHASLEKKEIQEIVRREISRLPGMYAEIIVMKELENMSYEEINRALNISIDAIGVRLIRAREMLKQRLKKYL